MPARAESASASLASSFTDLMTSLAVIFILLLVAAVSIEQKALKEKQKALQEKQAQLAFQMRGTQNRRVDVMAALKKALSGVDLDTEEDPIDPFGVLLIPPRKLEGFEWKRADLPSGARDYLENFAPRLADVVCGSSLNSELSLVTVEGHADLSGQDAYNLGLSTKRSMQVVETCLQAVDSQSTAVPSDTQACFAKLLTASGRGRSEPIMVRGVEDPERSRRVIFKVRIKTLEEKNLLISAARRSALADSSSVTIEHHGTTGP